MAERPPSAAYYEESSVKRRVVITGLGIISPVGNDIDSAWDSIINGRSGIGRITHFDASPLNSPIAGEVTNFAVNHSMSLTDSLHLDMFTLYVFADDVLACGDSSIQMPP